MPASCGSGRAARGYGHRVTVLTCQPSYNRAVVERAPARERLRTGVTVRRWPVLDDRRSSALKLVNLAWFCLRLALAMPRLGRVDVVMAASTPPVVLAATASWLARRKAADFVYHQQDIYPEVTVGLGEEGWPAGRLVRRLDARTDRSASRVVVLSRDMGETIARRGVCRRRDRRDQQLRPVAAADRSTQPTTQPTSRPATAARGRLCGEHRPVPGPGGGVRGHGGAP